MSDLPELILTPKQVAVSGQVRISEYPCTVGRQEARFRELAASSPEAKHAISKMSRQHATLTYENGEFKVTDLGSLNGTYYNGQRLGKDESATFTEGEEVGFSEWLTFKVQIVGGDVPTLEGPAVDPAVFETSPQIQGIKPLEEEDFQPPVNEGATMVLGQAQRANSVFNLLVENKKAQQEEENTEANRPSHETIRQERKKRSSGPSLWTEFGGNKILLLIVAVGAIIGVAVWHAMTGPVATTKRHIKAGNYASALAVADEALGKLSPDSRKREALETLTAGCLIKEHIHKKEIVGLIQRGDYDAALELIPSIEKAAPNARTAKDMASYLRFAIRLIGKAEEIVQEKKIVAYRDEDVIRELLKEWKEKQGRYQFIIQHIQKAVSKEDDITALVNSHRAAFRNYENTLIKALNTLKKTTKRRLDQARLGELEEAYKQFNLSYAGPQQVIRVDISPLQNDLARFKKVWDAVTQRNVQELAKLTETDLQTAIFKERYRSRKLDKPSPEVLAKYATARKQWSEGKMEETLKTLKGLEGEKWGDLAKKLGVTYLEKQRVFGELQSGVVPNDVEGQRQFLERRKKYLAGPDDAIYRQQLETRFQTVCKNAQENIADYWLRAEASWKKYLDKGKIAQKHRLSNLVTADYVELAQLLATAYKNVNGWKRSQDLVGTPDAAKLKIYKEIRQEAHYQIKRMREAKLIVDEAVIEKKLKSLPEKTK